MRVIALFLLLFCPQVASAQYALLIGGLGGSADNTKKIRQHLFGAHTAFVDRFQFPADNVTVLAEQALTGESFVSGVSTANNIRTQVAKLAGQVDANDHVFVLLFGHGSFDGTEAHFNIPRRDLTGSDYAALMQSLGEVRIIFINTTSASAPFIDVLSAPDRIIITATRTGTQRNLTVFPKFLVEALHSLSADMDRDGRLTVREVFYYAALKTTESFADAGHLATEHSLLEDTGDAQGHRLQNLEAAAEGHLAAITYFDYSDHVAVTPAGPLAQSRQALERDIAALKQQKADLGENEYYARLEVIFVALARLNDRLEAEDQ